MTHFAMARSRASILVAALAALLVVAAPASAATKRPVYVSLGDSLAWGYTKTADGKVAQSNRDYASLLAAKARTNRRYGKQLSLKKFGCPGESTQTYRNGGKCTYTGAASQQAAAVKFIRANRKRIGFITISIGANNFTPCARGLSIDIACVQTGNAALDRDLGPIFRSLRRAAGRHVPIVTHTQYNPYLALYLQGGDYRQLALLSNDLAKQINEKIRTAARGRATGLRVADVYKAFKAGELSTFTTVNGQQIPTAVGAVCTLTLMCRPAPVGPDIHPSDAGYVAMATAFGQALRIR